MSISTPSPASVKLPSADAPFEEFVEPVRAIATGVDKKIRNLEKKKGKLDLLREEIKKSGKPINEDQRQALDRYDDVVLQLDCFRELQKQLQSCVSDVQKCCKRALKKEQASQTTRLFDLERYRAIARSVETHFVMKGLAEEIEELAVADRNGSLKALGKVLLPSRYDFVQSKSVQSFDDYLRLIAEQQSNLLHGKAVILGDISVVNAKELLDRVLSSNFLASQPDLLYSSYSSGVQLPVVGSRSVEPASSGSSNHPVVPGAISSPIKDTIVGNGSTFDAFRSPAASVPPIGSVVSSMQSAKMPYDANGFESEPKDDWASGSFGTFDASKLHANGMDNGVRGDNDQENYEPDRSGSGDFHRVPHRNGRGGQQRFNEVRDSRGFDDRRRDREGFGRPVGFRQDERRDRPTDRGFRNGAGGSGGRYYNRSPRDEYEMERPEETFPVKPPVNGTAEPSDNDFGVFHIPNPSYRGRTSYDYRGPRRDHRSGHRNGPMRVDN